jgi:integrase
MNFSALLTKHRERASLSKTELAKKIGITVSHITESRLQEYLNYRINRDKIGLYAANNIIISVKAWLNWCARNRKIFDNPVKGIKKFKVPETPRSFLSKDAISLLFHAARGETLHPFLATAVYTGMRKDELKNLQWEDVDFTHGILTVRNKAEFTTKSKKNRTIPLHPGLRAILLPLRKPSGYCFDMTNYRRVFRRIVKKAKVPELKIHELRHTFASQALMAGIPFQHYSLLAYSLHYLSRMNHSKITTLRFMALGGPTIDYLKRVSYGLFCLEALEFAP